jgi:putative Holliday junction resolvase
VRILGIDVGRRRIGLAISDPSQTLARPLMTLTVARPGASANERDRVVAAVELVVREITRLQAEDDGLDGIVVGVPAHLDGSASEETASVGAFMIQLRSRTSIPIAGQDERLTSREAESRLARRERDWRKRKAHVDAAAAAIILQEYLDRPNVS